MSDDSRWAVECESVGRVYKSRSLLRVTREVQALRDLTMHIPKGIVFGLLGPNGAGKTTAVRILSTLLAPTTGSARVLGFDVVRQASQARRHIGLILGGDRGHYGWLTGRENLQYFGALNHLDPRDARRRTDQLLTMVGLADRGNVRVEQYSRGMKQRLHIARGLLTDPDVLFMDEPTMGLDPIGAQEIRGLIPQLVAQGKTVLLTTHYMSEADQLCHTVAMINKGELVALGTPTEIRTQFSHISVLEVTLKQARAGLLEQISSIEGVQRADAQVDGALQKLLIQTTAGRDLRQQVISVIGQENIETLVLRDPTLEEAYLSILR